MCRNIRTLYHFEPPVTDHEIHAASLQFVRKVSGFVKPSAANQASFDQAVHDVAAVVANLMSNLVTTAPPKNREIEAAKAKAKSVARFAKEREQKNPA
jgi:hypothetical protein